MCSLCLSTALAAARGWARSTRAYELARLCRDRGVPCIIGGPHAWAVPDEAAEYFDSVAVGECDETWLKLGNFAGER